MAIEYSKKTAKLTGFVSVDDAEALLEWLQRHPKGTINLSACSHLHPANLQVLMAACPPVQAWPQDAQFAAWLKNALNH